MNPDEIRPPCQSGRVRKPLSVAHWHLNHPWLRFMAAPGWRSMLIWLLGMSVTSVSADVYRCQVANGNPVFQDSPCNANSRPIFTNPPVLPTPVAPAPTITPIPTIPDVAPAPAATPFVTPHLPALPPLKQITPAPEPVERPTPPPRIYYDQNSDEEHAKRAAADAAYRAKFMFRPVPTFKERMVQAVAWLGHLVAIFGIAGSITFFGSHLPSSTLMPRGERNRGDFLFGRFWWRNLALAVWGTCALLPKAWDRSDWAHRSQAAFSSEQWQILLPLWLATLVWIIIAWFLVKSSLIAGYPRRYSLWGQYAWFDEWMSRKKTESTIPFLSDGTSGSPTEPLGSWYPNTDPSQGPEGYHWVALQSLDEIRKGYKAGVYILVALLVFGIVGSLLAKGFWQDVALVVLFSSIIMVLIVAKDAAHIYHHRVMEKWVKDANR